MRSVCFVTISLSITGALLFSTTIILYSNKLMRFVHENASHVLLYGVSDCRIANNSRSKYK